jgi:hypothetical protein
MAICKNVGFDEHLIADSPLSRETPTVHLWSDSFNDDASASVWSLCCHGSITFSKNFSVWVKDCSTPELQKAQSSLGLLLLDQAPVQIDRLVRNCCPTENVLHPTPARIAKTFALLRVLQ